VPVEEQPAVYEDIKEAYSVALDATGSDTDEHRFVLGHFTLDGSHGCNT
jgi:hypothetical protein